MEKSSEQWVKVFDIEGDNIIQLFYYQLSLILTALLHVDVINVAYLTACAFIKS